MVENKRTTGGSQAPLVINKPAAKSFLAFLDPAGTDQHAFQAYDDDKERRKKSMMDNRGADARARTWIGDFDSLFKTLEGFNRDGCAVHVTINYVVGRRLAANVQRVRKHFIEKDDAEPMQSVIDRAAAMGLPIAWANESSPGKFHYYFNIDDALGADLAGFTQRQKQLVTLFGAGKESTDLPRVLRVPGFWHQKGEPFQVRVAYQNASAPALGLVDFELLPDVEDSTDERADESGDESADDDAAMIVALTDHFKTFPRSISDTDTPDGSKNKKGNNTLFDCFAKARDIGGGLELAITLALEFYNPRCEPEWDTETLRLTARNAYQYAKGQKGKDSPGKREQRAREDFGGEPYEGPKRTAAEQKIYEAEQKGFRNREQRFKANAKWAAEDDGLEMIDGDKVEPQNVDHIWRDRLSKGSHTMLAGEGGKGKSQLAYAMAACITKGSAWPDADDIEARMQKKGGETPEEIKAARKAPLGTVIILSAEDKPNTAMVPRLIAAGADLTNIKILVASRDKDKGLRKFNLQTDLKRLEARCKKINELKDGSGENIFPPVTLIIFDPVSSYMGGDIDASQNVQIRNVLDPVSEFAGAVDCAVLSITHFNKGTSAKAVNKVMDSAAFTNAPRAVFGAYDDIEDIGSEPGGSGSADIRHSFLMIKTNGRWVDGLLYRLKDAAGGTDKRTKKLVEAVKVVWEGSTKVTANQTAEADSQRGDRNAPRFNEAVGMLQEEMREGRNPTVADVTARADAEMISRATLRRARTKLKVEAFKETGIIDGQWKLRFSGLDMDDPASPADPAI
jgi:hypothetical protein